MERPAIRGYPIRPEPEGWSSAAFVSLEVAAELSAKGYIVLIDPQDERDLAMHERLERAMAQEPKRKWYGPLDHQEPDRVLRYALRMSFGPVSSRPDSSR